MGVGLGGNNFYWNPSAPETQGSGSDWGRSILEAAPQAAYYRYGQEIGIPDDQSGFARWFRQQFPQFQTGYQAYTASRPETANITDYSRSLGGYDAWMRQYQQLAPQLRGEDPGSRGAGPVRWVGR